jgi:type IV pilus assembly protein PilB
MGIEPFLVASSVNCILAQRLARRVCEECKEADAEVTREALQRAGLGEQEVRDLKAYRGRGCSRCADTGYKGRIALYEVMLMNDEIKELVLQGGSTAEVKVGAIRMGMKTLRMSGINKLREGVTTVEELLRVTAAD